MQYTSRLRTEQYQAVITIESATLMCAPRYSAKKVVPLPANVKLRAQLKFIFGGFYVKIDLYRWSLVQHGNGLYTIATPFIYSGLL